MELGYVLLSNIVISLLGCVGILVLTPKFRMIFLSSYLYSQDLNKKLNRRIATGFGIVTTGMYLLCLIAFMPFAYMHENTGIFHLFDFASNFSQKPVSSSGIVTDHFTVEHLELVYFTAALLCICLMTLIGFMEDVIQFEGVLKFFFPLIALLPVLIVYYSTAGLSTVVLPKLVRFVFPSLHVYLGPVYYFCIIMLSLFYVNSVRFLTGTNGLEAGQALIISLSIIVFNLIGLSGNESRYHRFSLYFMIPFSTTTFGLLRINWYPAKVFVGDSFCASAGAVFFIVGVFGHFCESLLLFFIPQLFNFLYSLPQHLLLLPAPDDKSLRFNPEANVLYPRYIQAGQEDITPFGAVVLETYEKMGIAHVEIYADNRDTVYIFNHLTLPNLVLLHTGPVSEKRLTEIILLIQAVCSVVSLCCYHFTRKLIFG